MDLAISPLLLTSDWAVGTCIISITGIFAGAGIPVVKDLSQVVSSGTGLGEKISLLNVLNPWTVFTVVLLGLAVSIIITSYDGIASTSTSPASKPEHLSEDFYLHPGLVSVESILQFGVSRGIEEILILEFLEESGGSGGGSSIVLLSELIGSILDETVILGSTGIIIVQTMGYALLIS